MDLPGSRALGRRRGAAGLARGGPGRAGRAAVVNLYGPTEVTVWATARRRGRGLATAPSGARCRHHAARARRAAPAGAARRGGRAVPRRRPGRPRLPGPPGADRRPLRRRPAGGAAGSTAPATWSGGCATAGWSSSAAPTTRSRCAASGSSWARSRPSRWRHPDVTRGRRGGPRRTGWSAYLTTTGGTVPAGLWATRCRATWSRRLHVLDALPLTPNGKVDRAALPDVAVPVAGTSPRSADRGHGGRDRGRGARRGRGRRARRLLRPGRALAAAGPAGRRAAAGTGCGRTGGPALHRADGRGRGPAAGRRRRRPATRSRRC